jgi:hypothetical protein
MVSASDKADAPPRAAQVKRRHPTAIRQHNTHYQLVRAATPSAATQPLDAIIVPASREAHRLDHAISLAQAMNCQLILLCSRQAKAAEVSVVLHRRRFSRATVIEMPDDYTHRLFDFETSSWIGEELHDAGVSRDTDLSAKRNIGLALARMAGWKRVFFLDDDIAGFSAADLRRAVSMVGRYRSVGMRVRKFPDNSVVCHAHRATGGRQGVNVSGSALAVDCTGRLGFFPDIYNEDWLFFYDHAKAGRLASSGINVTQLRYDPFANPARAARQEFGDVLAEGLYAMLHEPHTGTDGDYWKHFLEARKHFLDAIIGRLGNGEPRLRQKIFDAVSEAQQCLAQIQPYHCEHYIKLWRADLRRWRRRLRGLPHNLPVKDALGRLGLTAVENCGPSAPSPAPAGGRTRMPSRGMVTTSPAVLSSMAADSALRTVKRVKMTTSGGVLGALAIGRRRGSSPAPDGHQHDRDVHPGADSSLPVKSPR